MGVVHLGADRSDIAPELQGPPRRLMLQLDELVFLAKRAGDQRLPMQVEPEADGARSLLESRLSGEERGPEVEAAFLLTQARRAVDGDPQGQAATVIARQLHAAGLYGPPSATDGKPIPEVVTALSVLASPQVLVVLDMVLKRESGEVPLRVWYAVVGSMVVQLATVGGMRYELSWFDVRHWSATLARAVTVDSFLDTVPDSSTELPELPPVLSLPHELMLAGMRAVAEGREDVLDELVRIHPALVFRGEGDSREVVSDLTTRRWLQTLEVGCLGRLRILVTAAQQEGERSGRVAGLVSWLLLQDGWHALEPRSEDGQQMVVVRRVEPSGLGRALAPLIAKVLG